MWIEPVPRKLGHGAEVSMGWSTLEQNDLFILQIQEGSPLLQEGVNNALKLVAQLPYRVILRMERLPSVLKELTSSSDHNKKKRKEERTKNKNNSGNKIALHPDGPVAHEECGVLVVVALSEREREIRGHWKWIEEHLMSLVSGFDLTAGSDEEAELYRFVLKKISGIKNSFWPYAHSWSVLFQPILFSPIPLSQRGEYVLCSPPPESLWPTTTHLSLLSALSL